MATSRSFGSRSLTTLPPITTSPSVASSSPATMRIVVVLPHPEGPRSTRNSRSPMVRSKSSTPTKPPHRLVTFRSRISATRLLCDGRAARLPCECRQWNPTGRGRVNHRPRDSRQVRGPDRLSGARVASANTGPAPKRAPAVERALEGRRPGGRPRGRWKGRAGRGEPRARLPRLSPRSGSPGAPRRTSGRSRAGTRRGSCRSRPGSGRG